MEDRLKQRRMFYEELRKIDSNLDLMPFVTYKYLSQKQEDSMENISEYREKYGFEFREYELLSNIIKKQENDDESYISDLKSSINVLKNSKNEYIKEVYSHVPEKTLQNEVLESIVKLLSTNYSSKSFDMMLSRRRERPTNRIFNEHLFVNLLMGDIASYNHEVVNVYSPNCGWADFMSSLEHFESATLFEKDEATYYHAIQNMIIHDIPLQKINLNNEEVVFDESKMKYDTIITLPYLPNPQRTLMDSTGVPDRYKDYNTKNLQVMHLYNLIEHLRNDGMLVTIISLDMLVKRDAYELRKSLIEENILEAIIEYGRSYRNNYNLILVIKKNKEDDDVFFFKRDENRGPPFISRKMIEYYKQRNKVSRLTDIISNDEIKENDYNLNPKRYVYSLNYEQKDLNEVKTQQEEYTSNIRKLDEEINGILEDMNKLM